MDVVCLPNVMMRIAAIDIGTNTILMLVADSDGTSIQSIVRDEHVIARLGKGVDEHRVILPETIERVEQYLASYKEIAATVGAAHIAVFGTSALRDAKNRDEVVQHIQQTTGLNVSTLSKEDEAFLTFRGAVSGLSVRNSSVAVVDIGGGSTEIALGRNNQVLRHVSLDMGSVRLTERFLVQSPPSTQHLQLAEQFVRDLLSQAPTLEQNTTFVGVAGTLTTLAAIDLQLSSYDGTRVNGYRLGKSAVERIFDGLRRMTIGEISNVPQILPGRADILLAGILILKEILAYYKQDSIVVSDRGLRFGILLREAERLAGR